MQKAREWLLKLRVIFISHHHSDHSNGIHGILKLRNDYLKELKTNGDTLYLIAPLTSILQIENYELFLERQNVSIIMLEELN